MNTTRKVTSKDVARLAGVAHSTVSRVINGSRAISEATRQRVLEAIRLSGYRPQLSGRALVIRRHETFAMVTGGELALRTYASNLLLGASEAVTELGYRLLLYATNILDNAEHVDDLPLFNSDCADGVIVETSADTPALEAALTRQRLTCVYTNPARVRTHNAILIDDVAVAKTATQFLIAHGHRAIAYLPYTLTPHGSNADRMKGYLMAMTEAGLAPLPAWQEDLPPDYVNGVEIARRIRYWRERHACTAIVVYNSVLLPQVLWFAAQMGLRVPEDLSVISCAFGPVVNMFPFPIAHISFNLVDMGRRAVRMLQERVMSDGKDLPAEYLPFELNPGASVCPLSFST